MILKDLPAHDSAAYPGENLKVVYKEGILVGYRWFDTKNIEPLYCFGYGLSYTNFQYLSLKTDKSVYRGTENITANIEIKNTGKYAGKETVQLYVSKSGSVVERAAKELKAFKKIMTAPGTITKVTLVIPVKDLAYYDVKTGKWIVEPGEYKLLAGGSSGEIKETLTINIKE